MVKVDIQTLGLIPDELLQEVHKGDCVLLLGTDYPAVLPTGDVPPGRQAFADKLAAKVGNLVKPGASLWEIAEAYEIQYGKRALIIALRDWIEETGNKPYPIHHAIAHLPVEAIITTAYDDRLEQALRAAGRSPVTVVNDMDVPFVGADKMLVLKLFGDAMQPESLVLTDDHQRNLKGRLAPLLSVVRYLFVIKTLLFVGYDMTDDLFKDLYAEVARGTRGYQRRGYATWPGATDLDRRRWEKKGVELVNAHPAPFLSQLQAQLAQLPSKEAKEPESPTLLHRRPYKFLAYFEPEDTEIFFGRETESLLLWRKILSHRMVVLFGPSGVGKTSLLNAGVWPRLARHGYRVCSVRVHTDPVRAVREAVYAVLRQASAVPSRLRPAREDLPSFFSRILKPTDRWVVFLDQFEELFVMVAPEVQERFLYDLAACLRDESWEVRFVLSLREDFLPRLETHRDQLLQYYANSFRLEPWGRAAAERAITDPAQRVGLDYEPGLVQQLLDDLKEDGGIAPPQLQIVCDRLYDHVVGAAQKAAAPTVQERIESILPPGKPAQEVRATITQEQYRELGGAKVILADYVDEVIAALPETQRDPARDVLKAMITAEETKDVLSQTEVEARSGIDLGLVGPVLENLVDYRLVRRLRGERETLYELAHEHLIAKIRSWVSPEELEAEMARRLLDQQVVRYREFGGLIDAETLKRIDRQRENPHLAITLPVELEMLFRSALAAEYEVDYWRGRADQAGLLEKMEDEWLKGLVSDDEQTVAASIVGLGSIATPRLVERLTHKVEADFAEGAVRDVLHLNTACQRRAVAALCKMTCPEAIIALDRWTPQGMVLIPAGPFTMGSTEYGDEGPVHQVWLDAFWIARHPVTNAEYAEFIAAGGYGRREYWTEAGWAWREREQRIRPEEWDSLKGKRDHPVRYLTWYESVAYTRWRGAMLPSEAQWEKAARGGLQIPKPENLAQWRSSRTRSAPAQRETSFATPKNPYAELIDNPNPERRYPWGGGFDREKCNTRESDIGDTTPMGKYSPEGDSPYGVADMAGNVWEWTSSVYLPYPYRPDDGREDLEGGRSRVLRGGSFNSSQSYARCSCRLDSVPDRGWNNDGCRVGWCAAPALPWISGF